MRNRTDLEQRTRRTIRDLLEDQAGRTLIPSEISRIPVREAFFCLVVPVKLVQVTGYRHSRRTPVDV